MHLVTSLRAFLAAVVIISATPGPGPAVALILRRTALRGAAYGAATIVGLEIGIYVWALLVASGFAVVAASETGFAALKIVGCCVLGWLAVRSLRSWWAERRHQAAISEGADSGPRRGLLWAVGEGFVVQMANPKAAIFLLALYPQFVAPGHDLFASTATLGILHVMVESAVYGVLMLSVARASAWFSRSVVRRRLEAVTGAVLVGLGIRLALTERP